MSSPLRSANGDTAETYVAAVNGANAELTEYFDRFDVPGTDSLLVVTSELVDTENLLTPYWTSQQFKRENGRTGWNPTPCAAR